MPETTDVGAFWTAEMHDGFRKFVASHPDLKFVTQRPRQFERFPSSFPGKLVYDAGFGSGVTKEWLLANMDEYSRPTFDTVSCNGLGWHGGAGRLVELQGQPVPGTLVVEHGVHRADLDGRVGLVVGSTGPGTGADLHVLWGPWRFKDDP